MAIVKVSITCPKCSKIFQVKHPGKACVAKVTCPACSTVAQVKFGELPPEVQARLQQDQPSQGAAVTEPVASELGGKATSPVASTAGTLPIKDKAEVPEQVHTQVVHVDHGQSKNAKIVVLGGFLRKNKEYLLHQGETTIGRADTAYPSEIQLNDPTVSRRSISILTTPNPSGGYLYKLTILKATNPVSVNGKLYETGASLYINIGTIIQLGKTKIRIDELK